MKLKQVVKGILLAGLVVSASAASAATVTLDFNAHDTGTVDLDDNPIYEGGLPAQIPGYANEAVCVGCYAEDGFLVGTLTDPLPSNHIHGDYIGPAGTDLNYSIGYHNDSSGVYIRAADGGAFKAFSLFFDNNDGANTRNGTWEILGFNTAVNTSLQSGNGTVYANRVAYQTVAQNNSNPRGEFTLNLNSDFNDADGVNAIWIHWRYTVGGNPTYLNAATANALTPGFKVNIDNIVLEKVAAVPVPAAAWLFGSGLLGLLSLRKRSA